MHQHFERAQLLIGQQRYVLAQKELHQALTQDPNWASAYALLAVCLNAQDQPQAALQTIGQAIGLSPTFAGFHYIRAGILTDLGQQTAAARAIAEALRLDPEDVDCYARQASIQYDQSAYEAALRSAAQGLQLEAMHIGCMNLRLLALMQLRQLDQAEAEVQTALHHAPENAWSHAIQGWIGLYRSRIPAALESFRTALQIAPDLDWARQGLLEAMKARHGFYRTILQFDLWRSRMDKSEQMALVGLMLIPQVRAIYLLMLGCIALSQPIFTFLLSFDAYGKLTLTRSELVANRWTMAGLGTAIGSITLSLITQQIGWLLGGAALWLTAYGTWHLRYGPITWPHRLCHGAMVIGGIMAATMGLAALLPASSDLPLSNLAAIVAGLILGLAGLAIVALVIGSIVGICWKLGQWLTQSNR
jgi:tetratricopeptide (TPR) repeat protein